MRVVFALLLAIAATVVPAAGVGADRQALPLVPRPQLVHGAGTLVFFSYRELRGSFYAESAAGGPLRLLLTGTNDPLDFPGALFYQGVVWAPDGNHFVYLVLTGQSEDELRTSDLTGTKTQLVGRTGSGWPPSWSPDGRRLAFQKSDEGIWVVRANGSDAHALTSGPVDQQPRWSPDGRAIAFTRSESGCGDGLMTVRPSGGAAWRLARNAASAPSWSPNGKQIAFEGFTSCLSTPGSSYPTGLYITDRRGRHLHLIDRAADGPPVWSPDGKWIAVARGGEGPSAAQDGTWIEHPNGHGRHRLSTMVPYTVDVDNSVAPVWAPDSRRLAGVFVDPGDQPAIDVWVLGLDGTARQITQGSRYGYNSFGVSWQPRNLPPQRLGGSIVSPAIPSDSLVADGVLEATRPVGEIVAEGARVAIRYEPGSRRAGLLNRTETWNTASNSVVRYPSFNEGGIALAGDRLVEWSGDVGISIATDDHPNGTPVQDVCPPSPPFCEADGPAIGDVIAGGSLIVYDSWKRLQATCGDSCPGPKRDGRLFRIDDGNAVQIASSSGELTPLAVDDGRILVNEGSGTLAILDANGAEHLKVAVPGFMEATLQGRDLVVHTGETLADYDAMTGVLVHAWHVSADATLQDVQDGLAVYVTSSEVHLLRLDDGHDSTIRPPGSGPLHAQLDSAGLFYSYTADDAAHPGRVIFVPFAQLPLR